MLRTIVGMATILVTAIPLASGQPAEVLLTPTNQDEMVRLTPDKEENREISAGEEHEYVIELERGEMVFLRLMQKNADVMVTTFDPKGAKLEKFDTENGKDGPEIISILPMSQGQHTLKVKSIDEGDDGGGSYGLSIEKRVNKTDAPAEQLDSILQYWASKGYLPGFSVSIVTKDDVLFQKGYGFADLKNRKPYTETTLQNVGSISKTLIGISLMKLVEDGKLQMSANVNDILPYHVNNPHHPDTPITIEQLATHTSSIGEMDAYEKSYVLVAPFKLKEGDISDGEFQMMNSYHNNLPMPVNDFLKSILTRNGKWYADDSFLKNAPGERFEYSNAGATLAACVIEAVTGQTYADYTRQQILKPLNMEASGWRFDEIDMSRHANLHFSNHQVIPRYTLNSYPDGGLISSVSDMGLYLREMIKGHCGESELLKPESFRAMMANHLSNSQSADEKYGYFWKTTRTGEIGHNGGDPGAVNLLRFNPETRIGKVLMTNVIPMNPMALKQFKAIWKTLEAFEGRLGVKAGGQLGGKNTTKYQTPN